MSRYSHLILYFISMATSLSVGGYAWRQRSKNGALSYAIVALSQAIWTLSYIFELTSATLTAKIFWDDVQWIMVLVWPMALLAFTLEYTGYRIVDPRRLWRALSVPPVILLLLAFTNRLHHWFRPDAWIVFGEPFPALVYDFSIPMWGISLYIFLLVASCGSGAYELSAIFWCGSRMVSL